MTFRTLIAAFLAVVLTTLSVSAQDGYRIRPGDSLTIEILEDPSLNRQALVLPDGRFSFPFAGPIQASGKTIEQIQVDISGAIASNFAATPNVFVSVDPTGRAPSKGGRSRKIDVYFLGELGAPGLKELKRGTTFLQAMASSGGFSKFAATKRIQLRRTDKRSGKQTIMKINYKAFMDGTSSPSDFQLQDGDVILIPERRLFE